MTFDFQGILNAIGRSLTDPALAAQEVLKTQWDRSTLWTVFALVAVLNALLQGTLELLMPGSAEQQPFMPAAPIFALLMVGFLALNTFLTHNIGRMMGGQGSFDATLTLMAWFQVVSLALTAVQFVLMLLSPILGLLFSVVSFALLMRCMVMFVDVLHGFGHLGKAFGTALAALFASVLVGVLFLPLLGVEMPGGPI